jgi:SAM-dependent methyltransferase
VKAHDTKNGDKAMLKPEQDAYGKIVLGYLQGGKPDEIVERDDGWICTSGGAPNYFAAYKDWPAHQKKAATFVKGRVLDVGCGAGRWCLHLQKRGHDVVGIDVSPLAVETCRRRGVKRAEAVPITRVGPRLGVFDTILMMGNNFGLFGSGRRARWLLKRFGRITTPGARIVAESNDPYATKDPDHLAYQRFNRGRGRMSGQLRIRVRCKRAKTPWFDYLIVSKKEMERILRPTGWCVEKYLDSGGSTYVAVIAKCQ